MAQGRYTLVIMYTYMSHVPDVRHHICTVALSSSKTTPPKPSRVQNHSELKIFRSFETVTSVFGDIQLGFVSVCQLEHTNLPASSVQIQRNDNINCVFMNSQAKREKYNIHVVLVLSVLLNRTFVLL